MTCDDVRPRLTAYLDGDLDPDRGTVVRGHLRTCEACRRVATEEAALRDGLRALPTLDPPPALWANIQAQLAEAEVAEARRPGWKRALARWTPMLPRFAMGGALAMAALGVLWWRSQQQPEPSARVVDAPSPKLAAAAPSPLPAPATCDLDSPAGTDVTADLAAEAARVTRCYAQTTHELLARVTEARGAWSAEQRAELDAHVTELRAAIDAAEEGRPRQRAYRALNRYLRNALIRDQVALAGVAP